MVRSREGRNDEESIMKKTPMNRRDFVKTIGFGVGGPLIVSGATLGLNGAVAANDRIRMAAVGLGARGISVMRGFMRKPAVEMVAVCDVDRHHYRDGVWGKGFAMGLEPTHRYVNEFYAKRDGGEASQVGTSAYEDYREICGRSDIDAVIVATPDHWHAKICLNGAAKGKHMYGRNY